MAGAEPIVVQLKTPIQFGTELVTEFRLRRPKAKDFRRMPMAPTLGDLIDLAGALANQPKAVVDDLDFEDLGKVMEIVGGFVPGGLESGSTASP